MEIITNEKVTDLEERVKKFNTLQLPGQPMSMHMGTSYLINDLWNAIKKLQSELESYKDNYNR